MCSGRTWDDVALSYLGSAPPPPPQVLDIPSASGVRPPAALPGFGHPLRIWVQTPPPPPQVLDIPSASGKGHYKIIGQMVVVCLLQGLVSPHFFSERLFHQIAEATTVEAAREAVGEASEELSLMGGMRFLIISHRGMSSWRPSSINTAMDACLKPSNRFHICGANEVLIALRKVFIEYTTPLEAEDIHRAFRVNSFGGGSNRRRMEARTIGFWKDWLQTVEGGERPLSLGDYEKFQEAMENGISWGATFGLG
ncbi:hypothetical protein F7725_013516 [Dissostichus mawsoni]|uniref:Uncharacterized protein n=1 Tax=Dissostichus mawsoni TaxID=36200 RepID=A0A7J5Y435_DISMA|nr:hypothetical protein F7725_013516 [Dissostichus mawsoni]